MNRVLIILVALSLAASATLGFVVYKQGEDLRNAQSKLDAQLGDAEDRLKGIVAAAIKSVPDVDAVQDDLDELESKLFGFSARGFQRDVVGMIERDVSSLERSISSLQFDLSSFKSCMNRALSQSFASYDRAANSYFGGGTYLVSRCY